MKRSATITEKEQQQYSRLRRRDKQTLELKYKVVRRRSYYSPVDFAKLASHAYILINFTLFRISFIIRTRLSVIFTLFLLHPAKYLPVNICKIEMFCYLSETKQA